MALGNDYDDQNDAASSHPLTRETTASKGQRSTTSTGTPTLPSPSLSSSSDPPSDSLHAPPLPTPLPFDLVEEILWRLPVKSLMQLRCVCMSWNSLIIDSRFARKHLRGSRTRLSRHHLLQIYFCGDSGDDGADEEFRLRAFPLPSVFNGESIRATPLEGPLNNRRHHDMMINGYCDGILCSTLVFYNGSRDDVGIDVNMLDHFVLIWNPSIRKFKILPPLENQMYMHTKFSFGYDHFTDNYKVVAVSCDECDSLDGVYKTQVRVHTLGTDSWRRIQEFPSGLFPHGGSRGEYVSGTVNWLAYTNCRTPSSSCVIVSFDLGTELYQKLSQPDYGGVDDQKLSQPEYGDEDYVYVHLGVLKDCLCIIYKTDMVVDLWIMKDFRNKESWTKLFTLPHLDPGYDPYFQPLYLWEDDQLLLCSERGIVVYNSRNGTFNFLETVNKIFYTHGVYICSMYQEVYVESLISPCP